MRKTPPCTIAIFGAVGDLTKTLLMPAVYDLAAAGLLDDDLTIVGLDHNDRDVEGWRDEMRSAIEAFAKQQGHDARPKADNDKASSFVLDRLQYVRFDFTSDADYRSLAQRFGTSGNVLFYFAVAPRFFEAIAAGLSGAGLLAEDGTFRRLIIEKPFGNDLASARELNAKLTSLAAESQLFRIDHFLGKEAVQGISALRFANGLFEPLFNSDAVSSVQITAAETVGVAERGSFYEGTGALRDMMPNHLFSLLTLVAMERPSTFESEAILDAKAELLANIRPIDAHHVARGQYAAGSIDGKAVRAYREEDNVARDSRTETYAALTAYVDNDRWQGVPFYLRTGKCMSAHVTTISLTLRPSYPRIGSDAAEADFLLLGIDPERGLVQRFSAKRPGVDMRLGRASMGFRYETTFDEPPNVGYETLLYHALCGEAELFQRSDMIELEWAAVAPVLEAWAHGDEAPEPYAAGTDGPAAADALLARDHHRWLPVAPLGTLGLEDGGKPDQG